MSQHTVHDITVRNLTIQFGETMVLDDISLDVTHGQITSILGPSGCGKTTLLKCMMGMMNAQSGEVRVLGRNVLQTEREKLSKFLTNIGVTFQQGALFGSVDIAENVALPLKEHTDMEEEAIDQLVRVKLALVDMEGTLHKMPSELSGGMQKRAAIARALVLDPPILFFDEPSAGLDPVTAHQLDELILFINRTLGSTIVVVTHEIQSAMRTSDDVVFLYGGDIRQAGTLQEFQNSSDPAVQQFLRCSGTGDIEPRRDLEEEQV